MQVLISGGGIGGMAAAVAAARAGWDVRVFERAANSDGFEGRATVANAGMKKSAGASPGLDAGSGDSMVLGAGAGIQLGPNATRILHSWGLQHALASCAAFPEALVSRSAASGRRLAQLGLGARSEQCYGAPYVTLHRADLLQLLRRAADMQPAVRLRTGCAVVGHAQSGQEVTVRTQEGIEIEGDALVAADGLWSPIRQRLLDDVPPRNTGHMAYRALVRQADLPAILRSNNVTVWMGAHLHLVQYPVHSGEWMNLVVIITPTSAPLPSSSPFSLPSSPSPLLAQDAKGNATLPAVAQGADAGAITSWNQTATTDAVCAAVGPVCGALQELLQAVPEWRGWTLHDRAAVTGPDELSQGCVALLGDAAHPMLPYLAQGAGMAIEDAAELGRALALVRPEVRDVMDLPTALRRYALNRWQRVAKVQEAARRNGRIFHETGLRQVGRDLALRLVGGRLMDMPWLYKGPA